MALSSIRSKLYYKYIVRDSKSNELFRARTCKECEEWIQANIVINLNSPFKAGDTIRIERKSYRGLNCYETFLNYKQFEIA